LEEIDEFLYERAKNSEISKEISEGKIQFDPTYQFMNKSNEYSNKKVPSWYICCLYRCDRILFKNTDIIKLVDYSSVGDIMTSDHRPVYAIFKVLTFNFLKEEFEDILFQKNLSKEEFFNQFEEDS